MTNIVKPCPPVLNSSHPLARGLVGAWLMNEGGGTWLRDSSLVKSLGTFAGTVPTWGLPYPSLAFGGAGWVACGANSMLDAGSSLSIVVRANSGAAKLFLLCKGQSASYDYGVYSNTSGTGTFFYGAGSSSSTSATGYFNSAWNNFVVTASAEAVTWYRNGLQFGSAGAGVTLAPQAGKSLAIGARPTNADASTTDFRYTGSMEHVYIYNRVLMPGEVHQLHADPYRIFRAPPATRLVLVATVGSTVQLSWTDNSSGAQTFSIERSTTSAYAGFAEIATGETGPTYNDSGLADDTYWYRVRGTADGGTTYSDYTNVVEVTTTT